MLRLVARYGDEWNWWTGDPGDVAGMQALVSEFDVACRETGRDPASVTRSIDLFSIAPPEGAGDALAESTTRIAQQILAWSELGFAEARLDLRVPPGWSVAEAVGSMEGVVAAVHRG